MTQIAVLAIDKCITTAIFALQDVISIANMCYAHHHPKAEFPFFQLQVVTERGEDVLSFNNLPIHATHSFRDGKEPDVIIVPPVINDPEIIAEDHQGTISWLKKQYLNGAILASACTGIFFIAETGFLNGKSATTNPRAAAQMAARYPGVHLKLNRLIVDEGQILTAGSALSFLDLYLYIIEKFCGNQVAVACSKTLHIEKNRHSQAQFFTEVHTLPHTDQAIENAQGYIQKNFTREISIDVLASDLGMSPRNFIRRFKSATGITIVKYIQSLRIQKARNDLENTMLTVDEITYGVGYSDSSSFSRLFKKYTSLSPAAYRKKFSAYQSS